VTPQVILHVGLPKCASTTVQRAFVANEHELRSQGVLYPKTGRLVSEYKSHAPWCTAVRADVDALVDRLRAEASDVRTVFLTSEEFTSLPRWQERMQTATSALNDAFGPSSVSVLLLVRNHFDYAESCFAQFINAGVLGIHKARFYKRFEPTISGFAQAYAATNGHHFFSLTQVLRRVEECVPANQVEVMSIERDDLSGRDVTEALSDRLGLTELKKARSRNQRFATPRLLALNRAQHRYGVKPYRTHRRELLKATRDGSGRQFSPVLHVTSPLFEAIRHAQAEDGATLAALPGRFDAVLACPDRAEANRFRYAGYRLSEAKREAIDRIMT
jgi:hypothetical protein